MRLFFVYADDLNAMGSEQHYNQDNLKERLVQGEKIEATLQKLLLQMHNDKTQFIIFTHSQRRKASRLNQEERKKRVEDVKTVIRGETITKGDDVKTLGVRFESYLCLEAYWREVRAKTMKKLYGSNQVKSTQLPPKEAA